MSARNDGGPAFPVSTSNASAGHQTGPAEWQFPGMTQRAYFAAHAPDAPPWWHGGENKRMSDVIEWRVAYADAMLSALQEGGAS